MKWESRSRRSSRPQPVAEAEVSVHEGTNSSRPRVAVAKSILRGSIDIGESREHAIVLDDCSAYIDISMGREYIRKPTSETVDMDLQERSFSTCASDAQDPDDVLVIPEAPNGTKKLEQMFPDSTRAEKLRFLRAFGPENCETILGAYLEFRRTYLLDSKEEHASGARCDDSADWEDAWTVVWDTYECKPEDEFFPSAIRHYHDDIHDGEQTKPVTCSKARTYSRTNIPQYAFCYYDDEVCHDGRREKHLSCTQDGKECLLVHVLPMNICINKASSEMQALALALYMERKLNRDDCQQFRILLDVKSGPGMPNPKPHEMIGFIRTVTSRLDLLFAGRFELILMFPTPRIVVMLWNAVKSLLPTMVAESGRLVSGELPHVDPKTRQSTADTRQRLLDKAKTKKNGSR